MSTVYIHQTRSTGPHCDDDRPGFEPCPTCGGRVHGVGVDDALTVTYLPCGHTTTDAGEETPDA